MVVQSHGMRWTIFSAFIKIARQYVCDWCANSPDELVLQRWGRMNATASAFLKKKKKTSSAILTHSRSMHMRPQTMVWVCVMNMFIFFFSFAVHLAKSKNGANKEPHHNLATLWCVAMKHEPNSEWNKYVHWMHATAMSYGLHRLSWFCQTGWLPISPPRWV